MTSEYLSWKDMIKRCTNPTDSGAKNYLERGIEVCDRWLSCFDNFLEDMGLKPTPQHTLERKDNSLGYSPENCCWATRTEQARNRRSNRLLTYQGRTQPLSAWAEELGLTEKVVRSRLSYGYPTEIALSPDPLPRGVAASSLRRSLGI